MATIQIKHVPDSTHTVLRRRASAAGQSLQEYMLTLLNEQTERPTMAEVMDRVEERLAKKTAPDLSITEIRRALEDERARR